MESETTLQRLKHAMERQIAGELAVAEATYLQILDVEPDNADANHLLGLVRSEQDRDEEAVSLIQKALTISPEAAPFHHNIAGIYRRQGQLVQAEDEFRTAIKLKADYGEAYQGLAEMVRFEPGDTLYKEITSQLAREELDQGIKSYFHFAAGKFLDDVGEYSDAFRHYSAGNKLANKSFDNAAFRQQIKDTIYLFGPRERNQARGHGHPTTTPIFVVGMPRSGTTLIEQIISSHSLVHGAGELNDMKYVARMTSQIDANHQPWPRSMAGIGSAAYRQLANAYLQKVEHLMPDGCVRLVDKHPLNFQFLGLILLMFPNARIIHTIRHPLDTCLSCFFQNFTRGQHYSFDLKSLAHFYRDYRRVMEHWQMLFPGRILNVEYERVLAQQEQETRRLLEFCDLPFEQACIDYHENRRTVKTASFLQVRQPLYRTSQNRWRNYQSELRELAEIIGLRVAAPVTITSGSSILS